MDSIALGWSGLTCFVLLFGFALLYLYRKDHDTHKLMFALGILPGALTFSINALDSLKISIPDVLLNRMIDWGCVPLSICVFFILFSQIFFKKKDFKIIFRTFLFFFIISFIIFVSGMVTDTMFSISIPIGTLAIIVFSFVLLIRDRNISSILFILAMICFTLGGITLREFRESPSTGTVFGPLFCYFMSYILLILIVRTALSNVETKGIETYFTLKNKLKTAETTLETTEKRYQMIVENSVDTVMLTQPDGIISYVSPSCESVLGYKPEELIGQRPNIVHPDDSDLVQKIFSQALQGGSSPSFQYRIQTKKGETKWISHVFTTLKQDNRLEMIVSTLRDLTDIKLVEKELFEKISLLENSERATLNIMDDLQETIGRVEQAKADINQHEIHLENLFALYKMENVTDKEIFNFTLQATLKSTQSELGFIETMSKAEMVETIQAWSKQVAGQCNIMDKTVQFPITQTGLLEEIVRQRKPLIVNDYESSTEFKKGYLTGPVPIKRFLGIPIFSADRIVAVGVVANKMAEYTESDVKYFSSLLHEMWNCIERKQAGDALNESEERHRVLFESSQDALMTIEPPSWNFTSGNPATLELFKAKSEEEFTSQGPGGLSPERQPDGRPSAEKAKEMIETAIRNGSCFFEWTHKRLDGEDFSATVLLSRIKQGEKVFLQATVRDITEMKEIQQKLIKAYDEVKKLAKQKNDFINQLGHDLKNPLGPIINLLPIVTEDTKDSKLLEVLDVINRNAMYMKELVMNTLALAQLEGKTINFDFQILDLFTLVENTIADNGYLLEENNIKTENRMDKEIAVNADALRLKEVLTNLLSNSIHYMYKYGVEKTGGKIIINAKKDNNFVTVSIQDTGVGLTVKQLEHLFEEFYKADSSRHDRQSTGLGLAICKRIVEKHGGKIWVDSEGLEKGSTFFFTIPISINQETNNRKNN